MMSTRTMKWAGTRVLRTKRSRGREALWLLLLTIGLSWPAHAVLFMGEISGMIEDVSPPSSTYSAGPFAGTYSYDSALSSGASVSGAKLLLMFSPTASFEFHNVTLDLDPDGTPTGAFGEVPMENADGLDPVDDVSFVVEIDVDGNGVDDTVLGIESGSGVRLEGAELETLNAHLNSGMFDGASFLVREIAFTVGIDVDGDFDDDLVVVTRTAPGSMAFGQAVPAHVNDGGTTFSLLSLGCLILACLYRVRASREKAGHALRSATTAG